MDGDKTLKSLFVGRLGAAVMTIASGLFLFLGIQVTPADSQSVLDAGTKLINTGFEFASLATGAIALAQTLFSKYKTRG